MNHLKGTHFDLILPAIKLVANLYHLAERVSVSSFVLSSFPGASASQQIYPSYQHESFALKLHLNILSGDQKCLELWQNHRETLIDMLKEATKLKKDAKYLSFLIEKEFLSKTSLLDFLFFHS